MPPKAKAPHERAPNLTDEGIERIALLLDTWPQPKLTWELLIAHIHKSLGVRYTRQALDRHARISDAFQVRKRQLRGLAPPATREETQIAGLEAEVARLKRENHQLLEQFSRWLYNVKVIDLKTWEQDWREHREAIRKVLDKPLPRAERGGVEVKAKP